MLQNSRTFAPYKSFSQSPTNTYDWCPMAWYITNAALHNDLQLQTVHELSKSYYERFHYFHYKLIKQTNPFIY